MGKPSSHDSNHAHRHGDAHDASHPAHESHEGPIKTPKQLAAAVVASFAIPIIAAIMLANFVSAGARPAAGSDAFTKEAVAKRLDPVGSVEFKDLNSPASLKNGEQVYAAQCAACHASGAAGAPKFGDAAAWAPRLKSGFESLVQSSLKGKGAMGAQGGGDFADLEIARAVAYLANAGGGKFDEPKPQAAASSTAAAPTPAPAPAQAAASAAK